MRLLGGIFRPSLNQVTCGWGKLRIRGAGMTAPSPWETDWERSPSSKLPITRRRQMYHKHKVKQCQRSWQGTQECWRATHIVTETNVSPFLLVTSGLLPFLWAMKCYFDGQSSAVSMVSTSHHERLFQRQHVMSHKGTLRAKLTLS